MKEKFQIIQLIKKELSQLNLNIKECKESSIDCLLKFEKFFKKSDYKITRIANTKFEIDNKNYKKDNYLILPFIADPHWDSKKYEIEYLNNVLMGLKVSNSKEIIIYSDSFRVFLRIISLILFILLLTYIFIFGKNQKKKFI